MKPLLKKFIFLFFRLAVCPLVALYKICSFAGHQDTIFCSMGQFLSLFPGKTGSYLRVAFYSDSLQSVSPNCHIDFGSYFPHPDVVIHEGVYIGAYCIIGKCEIGSQTLIGSFANILSGNRQHNFNDIKQPLQTQGGEFVRITIGENCWIGNNSIVMNDIGARTVIGAGAIVVKPIPQYSVAVGNPCKVIKDLRQTQHDH